MCIGHPMRVLSGEGLKAWCEGADGVLEVDLALTGPLAAGTQVLVHVTTALRVLEANEAKLIADALEALARAEAGQPFEHLFPDLIGREPQLPAHLRPSPEGAR
jgi:hydrogenase expression/formation protein HypC